jgi:hypothetical protein
VQNLAESRRRSRQRLSGDATINQSAYVLGRFVHRFASLYVWILGFSLWVAPLGCFIAPLGCFIAPLGCGSRPPVTPLEANASDRLYKLFNLYRLYIEKNRKGPASEQELLAFGKKLDATERESRNIGSDVESIFISPRDKKNFVVRYNLADMNAVKAIAWEAEGKDGRKFVALTRGNVEEYDEQMFKEYTK